MPNVAITLPNVDESVTRPLVADLTRQLQQFTGLDFVKDVRFMNYNGNVRVPDSAVGESKSRYATFSGQTRMFVEVEEDVNQDGWASTVVDRIEHIPLFADPQLDIWVTPVVVPTDLVLKVRFQTRSRDEARRWRDDIVMRLAQLREGMQHTLTFNINLPTQLWGLIEHVWEKREALGGYDQDYVSYVKQHADKDLTVVSNSAGQQHTFAFRRVLARVNGRFDISPIPDKPTFDESGGVWECTLSYKITYDRPTGCNVRYPIQVHQQFLDDKYILPVNVQPNMNDREKKLSQSQHAFSMFETYKISGYYCHQDAYIQIPPFDDFVYRTVPKATATVVLGLLQLEKPGPQVMMNLGDIGDDQIDEDILQFLREVEYPWLNKPYESFFAVNLFREQDLVHSSTIEVDDQLNIFCNEDMSVRKNYRVRFSIVVDPSLLPLSAFERLYKYPKVIAKLVAAINEALRYNIDFQDLLKLRPLHEWEFSKLWHLLNGLRPLPESSYGSSQSPGGTNWKPSKGPNKGEWSGGYTWNGNNWVSGGKKPGRSNHVSQTNKPNGVQGNGSLFGIPDWAYEKLLKTPKMRTVQISGILTHRKN